MSRTGLFAAALAALLVVLGWSRLRFDTEVLALLPPDLPTVQALERHQRHFAGTQDLIVTLQGDDPEVVSAAAREIAEALRTDSGRVERVVWLAPWEERPDLTAELVAAAWLNAPTSAVVELANRLESGPLASRLEEAKQTLATSLSAMDVARAGYDPLGLGEVPGLPAAGQDEGPRFASEDGRYRILWVTPTSEHLGLERSKRWLDWVGSEIRTWQGARSERATIRWRLTGGPAIAAEVARGMERDMVGSVLGTALVIALLFGWAHRRWRPLLWIFLLLTATLGVTLGLGGLIFGRINSVSLGFAAILLGLVVDYGLVLYQEARALGTGDARTLRRSVGRGVVWSAITTSAAFATVTWSGIPGLVQLGALVALGSLVGAGMMLAFCVPPWMPVATSSRLSPGPPAAPVRHPGARFGWAGWLTGTLVLAGVAVLAARGLPRLDPTAAPLRPLKSEAYGALEEMRERLGGSTPDPWWLVAEGSTEAEVASKLREAERILGKPETETREQGRRLLSWQLPTGLWPDPERQRSNVGHLAAIGAAKERLRRDLEANGFSAEAFRYAEILIGIWERAGATGGVFWPTHEMSDWVVSQVASRGPEGFLALGILRPDQGTGVPSTVAELRAAGLSVGGWDLLGGELLARVEGRLGWMTGAMVLIWVVSLALALRSSRDLGWAVASVGLACLILLVAMAVLGWEWNLMNLTALPLLLGTGTDFAIHMLLALRRHDGNLPAVRRGVGLALFLCMATTVTGFGSLAWSGNAGLASLGSVCALGLASAYGVACWLLPAWWRRGQPVIEATPAHRVTRNNPSCLYHGNTWRRGLAVARVVPRPILLRLAELGGMLYALAATARREVVVRNLAPVVGNYNQEARRLAWRLFRGFGRKLADLWIYESGQPVADLFGAFTGWEHLEAARKTGRGVLLVTPHLGNWEFGAPLLANRGIQLVVITLSEPGEGFTEMRIKARARWGIETLVIGHDPFAFVEVIKRLQDGAVVALLIDRPPPGSGVGVSLFGRPFIASIAGAELARATGCLLLPVVLPATESGYAAHVLPPIQYDRKSLGTREARRDLTQDILRAFEPHLRQHADQWFHFVPVWPEPEAPERP
ncbi:MAG: MMPL family transporter [Limisphaerales bacterium]